MPVYRFKRISLYAFVSRLKLYQTVGSAVLTPYFYSEYLNEHIEFDVFCGAIGTALVAPAVLFAFTRFFNRIVGVVSIDPQTNLIRLGHLSFFGGRKDVIVQLQDIVPIAEGAEVHDNMLAKVRWSESPNDFLLVPTTNCEIVNDDYANQIFGNTKIFINHRVKGR